MAKAHYIKERGATLTQMNEREFEEKNLRENCENQKKELKNKKP